LKESKRKGGAWGLKMFFVVVGLGIETQSREENCVNVRDIFRENRFDQGERLKLTGISFFV
jgi:hypothetical protein